MKARGIALMVLLVSLVILSLLLRELLQSTSYSSGRQRYSADRIQATYLARSTLNLARFILIYDKFYKEQTKQKSDSLKDIWTQPIEFPLPIEVIQTFAKAQLGEKAGETEQVALDETKMAACQSFFDDFEGTATARIQDMSALLYLPQIGESSGAIYKTFIRLLSPNTGFMNALSSRNLNADQIAREVRDYIDSNDIDDSSQGSEESEYTSAQLSYRAANRPMISNEELRLVPSIDDELYDYLSTSTLAAFVGAERRSPARINLNTVGKNMFQALLTDVSNPEEIADKFLKDRSENERVYSDETINETLQSLFGLGPENIEQKLLTGSSDAFKIEVESVVGSARLKLEAFVTKTTRRVDPVVLMRIQP